MLPIFLFGLAVLFTIVHLLVKKQGAALTETFLSYLLLFNMGGMGLLAFYAHVFMAAETAESIGWAPGSPFQYEVAMANLSFGVLGVLSWWWRGGFWAATIIGSCVFILGDFVGHLIQYSHGDTAPNNIGLFIWFNDLLMPILLLALLQRYLCSCRTCK